MSAAINDPTTAVLAIDQLHRLLRMVGLWQLRAMVENLMQNLPEHRHPALQEEMEILDSTIESNFMVPKDRTLARIADAQGLGGPKRVPTTAPVADLATL